MALTKREREMVIKDALDREVPDDLAGLRADESAEGREVLADWLEEHGRDASGLMGNLLAGRPMRHARAVHAGGVLVVERCDLLSVAATPGGHARVVVRGETLVLLPRSAVDVAVCAGGKTWRFERAAIAIDGTDTDEDGTVRAVVSIDGQLLR